MAAARLVRFSTREQASFNFMAAVTICSDFGAEEKKVCHCFQNGELLQYSCLENPMTIWMKLKMFRLFLVLREDRKSVV